MPDRIQSYKVICEGGLNTNDNTLLLSEQMPGSAVRLVNYETALSGGYRRFSGFREYDPLYPSVGSGSSEGPVLGVWIFHNTSTDDDMLIAARKDTSLNTYKFFELTVAGWVPFVPGFTQLTTSGGFTTVNRVRAELFNFGDLDCIIFVDGVNPACVFNGTTWYRLTSSNTGGTGSPGGDQIIDKPSVVTTFKRHVFLSGDEVSPAIVSYCAPDDPLTWTAAAGGGQLTFGNEVVTMKPFRDENYIFGKNNIKKALPDVDAGFVLQDVTNNLGCIARDSVLEVGGNLIFLSADGIRPIAGTDRVNDVELSLLSQGIQYTIDNAIVNYDMNELNSVVIRKKTQFRYFLSGSSDSEDEAYGMVGCLRSRGTNGSLWEFGETMGIRTNCAWSGIVETDEVVIHGDYNGKVYIQETGSTYDGRDILGIYTTPYFDMGDTEVRKLMRKINTFIRAEGSVSFNISVRYDWGSETVLNPSNYTNQTVSGPITYDSGAEYDDGSVYGGATKNVLNTNIQGSCFSVQFSYVTVGGSPHTIQGFVTEFSPKGRE